MADETSIPRRRKSEDWIGHRQERLVIVAFEGIRRFKGGGRATVFRFRCDCGNEFTAQKSNVLRLRADCGCSAPAKTRTAPAGATKDPVHKVWWHMIDRCENPRNRSFKDYGQRGIKVCQRWKMGTEHASGFECFLADMGPRPQGMTIERVQGNAGYEPGNCIWLPKGDQSKNRRGVRLVRIGDRIKTIPDWCKETGIDYWTAYRRVSRGWPPDKAVTHPIRRKVA